MLAGSIFELGSLATHAQGQSGRFCALSSMYIAGLACHSYPMVGQRSKDSSTPYTWFFLPLAEPMGLKNGGVIRFQGQHGPNRTDRMLSICIRQLETTEATALFPIHDLMRLADGMFRMGNGDTAPVEPQLPGVALALTVAEVGVPRDGVSTSDAFDEAVGCVRHVQRAYGTVLQRPLKLLTKEQLPICVPAIDGTYSAGELPRFESMYAFLPSRHSIRRRSRHPQLDEKTLDELQVAIDSIAPGGNPFSLYTELRNESWVQLHNEGNLRVAGIMTGVAAEVFLDTLLLHLMWEERRAPQEAAAVFEKLHKNRVMSEYHSRLGGTWTDRGTSAISSYLTNVVYLRNRVAHAGYEPSYEQVMLAQNAVVELERYVGDLLTRQFKRWSLTCLSWTGTVGLAQRGIPAASVKMALQTNAEFDGWGTFDRWRQHFVRNRGGLQTPGSDPDQLQLLWVRTVDGKTHWFLADNATRMASSVDVDGVVSPEALDLIAKVQRALDESPPEVATRMDVRMLPGKLAKLSATWSPDYEVIPGERIFMPNRDASSSASTPCQ